MFWSYHRCQVNTRHSRASDVIKRLVITSLLIIRGVINSLPDRDFTGNRTTKLQLEPQSIDLMWDAAIFQPSMLEPQFLHVEAYHPFRKQQYNLRSDLWLVGGVLPPLG